MCIRDRVFVDPPYDKNLVNSTLLGLFTYKLIDPESLLIIAVSYTHLRAHETVLDLVCRLLLEKKKRKTYYNADRLEHTYR